jgi:hypothetical protein
MANYAIPMGRRLIVVAGRAAMAKNIFEKLLSIQDARHSTRHAPVRNQNL